MVNQFISEGKLKKSIEHFSRISSDDRINNSLVILMRRLNDIFEKERMGMISFSDANIEKNRITFSVQSLYNEFNNIEYADNVSIKPTGNTLMSFEGTLLQIIKDNKRRRPEIANTANQHLLNIRHYEKESLTKPVFDVSNRRKEQLVKSVQSFISSLAEKRKDDLESIVRKITEYLSEPVPSYQNLEEAYVLCCGRGMQVNEWVKEQFETMPEDNEVRITIAEKLEAFAGSINVK